MKNKIKYNKYDPHCNGSKTKYEYNANNFRLTRLLTTRNTGIDILQDINYTYDPEGNIVEIIDNSQQTHYFDNAVIEPKSLYKYDALYRLKKATGRELSSLQMPSNTDFVNNIAIPNTASDAMQNYTQQFIYDELGNINQMQSVGNWTRNYVYDTATNRLLKHNPQQTENDYTYDTHGNTTKMPHLQELKYDYADQLNEVTLNASGNKAYYIYDAEGERVRKVVVKNNGTIVEDRFYIADYELYTKKTNETLDTERETLHINDDKQKVALIDYDGTTKTVRYQLTNHLDSASLELDETGAIITYEEYHPFGTTSYRSGRNEIDVSLKRYKYVHKELDNETGLYYYGMRYYAPWIARFISVDSLQFDYPQLTPLQYASNDPIGAIDLDGAESTKEEGRNYRNKGNVIVTTDKKIYDRIINDKENENWDTLLAEDISDAYFKLSKYEKDSGKDINNIVIDSHTNLGNSLLVVTRFDKSGNMYYDRLTMSNIEEYNQVEVSDLSVYEAIERLKDIGGLAKECVLFTGCSAARPEDNAIKEISKFEENKNKLVLGNQDLTTIIDKNISERGDYGPLDISLTKYVDYAGFGQEKGKGWKIYFNGLQAAPNKELKKFSISLASTGSPIRILTTIYQIGLQAEEQRNPAYTIERIYKVLFMYKQFQNGTN